MVNIDELQEVLVLFSGRFFTNKEFAEALGEKYPETWKQITDKYGYGGKGAGRRYSPYRYIHSCLAQLEKLGRVSRSGKWMKSMPDWGSKVMAQWYCTP